MEVRLDPLLIFFYLIEWTSLVSSFVINIYLIRLVYIRGFRFGNYRHFIYVYAILDCLYALSNGLAMCMTHSDKEAVIIFSLSPWRENTLIFRVFLNLWFFSYFSLLLHISLSSLYRYSLLCNEKLLKFFEEKLKLGTGFIFWAIFFFFLMHTQNAILPEISELRVFFTEPILQEYNVDLTNVIIVGNKIEKLTKKPLIGRVFLMILLSFVFIAISSVCGYSIHTTLQDKAISKKAKRNHSKALKLLVAQLALPFLFLYIPTFIVEFFTLVLRENITMIIKIHLVMLISFYPVANAACIIFMTDDFRNYILSTTGGECNVINVMAVNAPIMKNPSQSSILNRTINKPIHSL